MGFNALMKPWHSNSKFTYHAFVFLVSLIQKPVGNGEINERLIRDPGNLIDLGGNQSSTVLFIWRITRRSQYPPAVVFD